MSVIESPRGTGMSPLVDPMTGKNACPTDSLAAIPGQPKVSCTVRREKGVGLQRVKSRPGSWLFHPVAVGTVEEVTNRLKLSMSKGRKSDSASRQAIITVNVEQASKQSSWTPTLWCKGEGRRRVRRSKCLDWHTNNGWHGSTGVVTMACLRRRTCPSPRRSDATRETRHGGCERQPDAREG